MAPIKLYIRRDAYGCVQFASFLAASSKDTLSSLPLKSRAVSTTKDVLRAMLQSGTSLELFNAAWSKAVRDDQVAPCRKLDIDDGSQTIVWAKDEASIIDSYISVMVNNPKSKFYICG
jgi:hypothetical protein